MEISRLEIPGDDSKGVPKPEISKSIEVDNHLQIKDHVGESYVSEKINISEEKVREFVGSVGDVNPIHFDANRVGESVFAEEAKGRIFVPGLYIQSLVTKKEAIYSALSIKNPCEIILAGIENTKFLVPVFAGSDVTYKFTISDATAIKVKSRDATKVEWKISASTMVGDRVRTCMLTKATLIYTSLTD